MLFNTWAEVIRQYALRVIRGKTQRKATRVRSALRPSGCSLFPCLSLGLIDRHAKVIADRKLQPHKPRHSLLALAAHHPRQVQKVGVVVDGLVERAKNKQLWRRADYRITAAVAMLDLFVNVAQKHHWHANFTRYLAVRKRAAARIREARYSGVN